jgi:DNA polymerase III epsilon subunit family exonuclease
MSQLTSLPLAFLDVETTGLSPWFGNRICEIAILRCCGEEILASFDTLINPERPISPGAARVNGLTDEDVAEAPLFADVADQVIPLLQDAIIVCHNAPFDLGFVGRELTRLGKELPPVDVIDTLQLARAYFDFDSNSLQAIAAYFMIDRQGAHRAMADVLTTRDVLNHFLVKLKRLPLDEIIDRYVSPMETSPAMALPPFIEEAFSGKKRLFIYYMDKKGRETQRWITPKQVLALNDYIYVAAYCHLRAEERYFRLDRITAMELEKE